MKIKVGVSNRHVHLCERDLETLFGSGYQLAIASMLSQGQEFASTAKVTIETPKSNIENVRVLGPIRKYTQVEVSKTDAYKLGINPPVRESGDLSNSAPITIIGPNGKLNLESNCIIASRHIHINTDDLLKYGLDSSKKYQVKVSGIKGGIFDNVSLKADPSYSLELHVDTDDANGFLINQGDEVELLIEE
jgi:putative phosphotransacetylase